MNIEALKKPLKDSVLVSLVLVVLLGLGGIDNYLPTPEYESLENFEGVLTLIEHQNQNRQWKIKLSENDDHRTFYVPSESCGDLSSRLAIGDRVQTKLNRRLGLFGSIRAWEVTNNSEVVVYYPSKNSNSISELLGILLLTFIVLIVGFSFLFYAKNKNAKS